MPLATELMFLTQKQLWWNIHSKGTDMSESIKVCFVDPEWLFIFIFSSITHYHTRSILVHVWTALAPSPVEKGLWLSPSVMRQLPIGLACWRAIMPQGQLRHNVSLSGCHTGQWRRVSHRRPTHPWAVPLPLVPGCGSDGVGLAVSEFTVKNFAPLDLNQSTRGNAFLAVNFKYSCTWMCQYSCK